MKGTYVIVIAFLVFLDVSSAEIFNPPKTKCPRPERDNRTTTHLAHETDCDKFYVCLNGRRIEEPLKCAYADKKKKERLHFNIFEQVCDWPWRAGCESCPRDEDFGEELASSKIAGSDSKHYFVCKNGERGKERKCSGRTKFSRTCQDCVKDREGGNCGDDNNSRDSSSSSSSSDESTTRSSRSCEAGNRIPHDCNCGKYYECDEEGDLIEEECTPGFHFRELTGKCTTPDKAKCKLKDKYKKQNFPAILALLQN